MPAITIVKNVAMVGGGGAVTTNLYSGDNSTTWLKGQLVKLASGVIAVVRTTSSAGALDSSTHIPTGTKLFLADADGSVATDQKVAVQRVKTTTRFIAPLLDNGASTPTAPTEAAHLGLQCELRQDTAGQWAPDLSLTSNPSCEITAIESETDPWIDTDLYKDSSGNRYGFVEFKILNISDV